MPSITDRAAGWVRRRDHAWLVALVAVALGVQGSALARVLPGEGPPPLGDSIIFEYYGWRMARGAELYVDLWEVKPPTSFQTTALLAPLAGGDPHLYHSLVVAATGAALLGSVVLVGLLAVEVTGRRWAGFLAGVATFAHPVVFVRATYGFKAKYFVVLAGLLAVYLLVRDRPFAGGVAAALATGYWQLAIVFPLVVLGMGLQRGGRRGLARVVGGGAAGSALTLAPVVLAGNLVPMLSQAVLAPALVGGRWGAVRRLNWLGNLLGVPGTVALLLGAAGVALALASAGRRRHWWLPAVWAFFLAHVTLLNVDYYGDLIVMVLVNGLAVGVLAGELLDRRGAPLDGGLEAPALTGPTAPLAARMPGWSGAGGGRAAALGRAWRGVRSPAGASVVVAVVLALVAVNAATLGAVAGTDAHPLKERANVSDPADVSPPYLLDEKRALLFEDLPPATCHVFPGNRQRAWMNLTNGSPRAGVCDRLPPGYEWLTALGPATPAGGEAAPPDDDPERRATPTKYPTLTQRPLVVVDPATEYRTTGNGTFVVDVPLSNEVGRALAVRVRVEGSAGGTSFDRNRTLTLAGGERRVVTFRVEDAGPLESIQLDVDASET